jgi:hypothetical protein
VLALVVAAATLAGQRLPVVSGYRAATIAVTIIGFVMCALGMGSSIESLGWRHPLNVAGCVLGISATALSAAAIFRLRLFGLDERTLLISLTAITVLKWAMSLLRRIAWG